jgi:hypothetical protein
MSKNHLSSLVTIFFSIDNYYCIFKINQLFNSTTQSYYSSENRFRSLKTCNYEFMDIYDYEVLILQNWRQIYTGYIDMGMHTLKYMSTDNANMYPIKQNI